MIRSVRIGTWNLAGRWTPAHLEFLANLDCDLLLLTEVSERLVDLPGYAGHVTQGRVAPRRRWAGVFSRQPLTPLTDPHPATALAQVGGLTVASSILPWRSAPRRAPWIDDNHAAKTHHAVAALLNSLPRTSLVWGGDWNHALRGREWSGSMGGRACISHAIDQLGLQVPTSDLGHAIDTWLSIDHVAVSLEATVTDAQHIPACRGDERLSDHDAYVVEVS